MRYMILIYSSETSEAAIQHDVHDEFRTAHQRLIRELSAAGELVDTHELATDGANIVRTKDGLSIIDGPHSPAGEWVGGYYLVDVADRARAIEIAARFVEARYATVEVRRLA